MDLLHRKIMRRAEKLYHLGWNNAVFLRKNYFWNQKYDFNDIAEEQSRMHENMRRLLKHSTVSFAVIELGESSTFDLDSQIYKNASVYKAKNLQEVNDLLQTLKEDYFVIHSEDVTYSPYVLGICALRINELASAKSKLDSVHTGFQNGFYSKEESADWTPDAVYFDEKVGNDYLMKPDFAPDYYHEYDYIGGEVFFKTSTAKQMDGFTLTADCDYIYDYILGLEDNQKNILHIAKPFIYTNGPKAMDDHMVQKRLDTLQRHLAIMGRDAEVSYSGDNCFRVKYAYKGNERVSILIPNKDQVETLKTCLDSIREKITYSNYQVIVIENNSTDPGTFAYYKELDPSYRSVAELTESGQDVDAFNERSVTGKVKVINCITTWNYSYINNYAARYADGDYLLLLNNDTEILQGDTLTELLSYAQREDVGAVGVKLIYPDETIQHGGVTFGIRGVAGHAFLNADRQARGYMNRLATVQNYLCVTAACLMVPRRVFDEVNGFDEEFQVAFNDVDLCERISRAGYKAIFDPYVELYHFESKSRGNDQDAPEKIARFNRESIRIQRRWCKELALGDPYYNVNLSLECDDFSLCDQYK